jgi:thiosulfate/3-mercaptopyruvate sulfurtransferase
MKIVTSTELQSMLNHPGIKLVDVRPVDAYNGWELQNEQRGGHIPGARSLPLKWTRYMDWIEVVRQKGLSPDDTVVVYGYSRDEVDHVAGRFQESGFNHVGKYYHFLEEWVPDGLPLERLPRFRHLVPARWVHELISGGNPTERIQNNFRLVHAHYRNRDAYLSGHLPGAIDMDTLVLEAPETWNRRSPAEIRKGLEEHGITSDTTVILYGKYMDPDNEDEFPGSAAGDIGAIRLAFIMLYAGVRDVKILNGGFQSWIDEGYPISYEDEPKKPVPDFGVSIPQHPDLAVDTPGAKAILKSGEADLVCVRSWPEYIGEVSGYNYIQEKGRIPGAIFGDCGSDAYHMENYRNFDHTTREYQEIDEIWRRSGIVPEKHLAFYCGTGWRGSEAWFNAWLMGWPRVSVYDGGWFEWSADPENPVESGVPENALQSG